VNPISYAGKSANNVCLREHDIKAHPGGCCQENVTALYNFSLAKPPAQDSKPQIRTVSAYVSSFCYNIAYS
jgi:hypothetical protein